ncbi:YPDG domain-containing protein [Corynebacterium aquatimens]|uniref:Long Rib domain-containing protein n=1 Tax=Corynebacterium aquatimens TaxID=1190508 RepID=A0A931DYR7_9CORY|nr:YPDG domain-containing protein [Corynebacterium aquatimens]MBG6122570.1 hypothetical protein [Corynebacterium aquatimens]WJY64890.1 hypothetical protein CAQUA_00735 [Corynebacterium aquatimens]
MRLSRKITASALALTLGAGVLTAPYAEALPATFQSPPGLNIGYERGCRNTVSHSVEPGQHARFYERSESNGQAVGTYRVEDWINKRTEFYIWAEAVPEGDRMFRLLQFTPELRNVSKQNVTYKIERVKPGVYAWKDVATSQGTQDVSVKVTDTLGLRDSTITLAPGESKSSWAQLSASDLKEKKVWMWKITAPFDPTDRDLYMSQARPVLEGHAEPWPFETDECQPMLPSQQKTVSVIADGREYDSGIVVANAKEDYERLTGRVFWAGKQVDRAQVRVDSAGKVFVTLQPGSTGEWDDNKPKQLDVEIWAKPRENTKDSMYAAYSNEQFLRIENKARPGSVDHNSKKFVGKVNIASFNPAYPAESTVQAGKTLEISLEKTITEVIGGQKVIDGTTFSVAKPVGGWNATIDKKTGTLTVAAPADARAGEVQALEVTVTYPDGSKDVLKPGVKVATEADFHNPKYGEGKGKPGDTIILEQLTPGIPSGSTYVISPNQILGDWKPTIDPNTGKITVVIPPSANEGDVQQILVDVTYPDGTKDERVPAKVTVEKPASPGVPTNPVTVYPGYTINITIGGPGTTATIDPSKIPAGWIITPGPDGTLTVIVPPGYNGPDKVTIPVTVTQPGGGTKVIEIPVVVEKPGTPGTPTNPIIVYPGGPYVINPTIIGNPAGTKFELDPKWTAPAGWVVTVDPSTGQLTVTVPSTAKPGETVTIPVKVTLPSGETKIIEVPFVVGGGTVVGQPGNPIIVYVPGGTNAGTIKLPEGWSYARDGDKITIIVPPGANSGNNTVVIPDGKGGEIKINVEVTRPGAGGSSDNGSSNKINQCFQDMSSEAGPWMALLPLGLLFLIGLPIAGPFSHELGKSIGAVTDKLGIKTPDFGNGGHGRPRSEAEIQAGIEAQRLNEMFGQQIAQAAGIGLALIGLSSLIGFIGWYCNATPEEHAKAGASSSRSK